MAWGLRNQPKAWFEDFVLVCATTVGLVELLETVGIAESVTYAFSIRPIVGAPSLAQLHRGKGGRPRTPTARPQSPDRISHPDQYLRAGRPHP